MARKHYEVDQIHILNKNYRPFCHVGNKLEDFKLGWFQDASFASNPQNSKSTLGDILCIRIPHVGFDFWDVQEAISSVPQQCRIGNLAV